MAGYDDEIVSAFLRNERAIKRYFQTVTGSSADSEDLAQEAWTKLARNGTAALAAPVPYLFRIVRSLAIDHQRSRKNRLNAAEIQDIMSVADTRPGPEAQLEASDQLRCLLSIIEELPDRQRAVLIQARVDRRPYAEIAADIGISLRTVELDVMKALAYCSQRLEQINRY